MIETTEISLTTLGKNEIIDITGDINQKIEASAIRLGHVLIFVIGSTGAVSTIEFEPGLIKDLPEIMDEIIPVERSYHHHLTWGDGNGHSHIRATLTGPSLTVPVLNGKMLLGTWQQVVFIEYDNKPHHRRIHVQIYGE